jgi:hypothetical protein
MLTNHGRLNPETRVANAKEEEQGTSGAKVAGGVDEFYGPTWKGDRVNDGMSG